MAITEILRPAGNNTISGSIQLFPDSGEAAWQNVDEVTSDSDTTYIFAANSGSSYRLADFSSTNPTVSAGTINSVTVHAILKSVSGLENARIWCGTIAGTATGLLVGSYSGGYVEKTKEFTTDPNTGAAWTWAAINDLLMGVSLKAFGGSNENRCTQVWAVISIAGEIFPGDAVARVSSIRHIFRPGFFRMQAALGDLGLDVDIAEANLRNTITEASITEEIEAVRAELGDAAAIERGRQIGEAIEAPTAEGPITPEAIEGEARRAQELIEKIRSGETTEESPLEAYNRLVARTQSIDLERVNAERERQERLRRMRRGRPR